MPIFRRRRLTTEEALEQKLAENAYYPFTKRSDGRLIMLASYPHFFVGLAAAATSLFFIVVVTVWEIYSTDVLVYPGTLFVFAVFNVLTYRHRRVYILDSEEGTYTFGLADKTVHVGRLHNAYIRLYRGLARNKHHVYYLVFNAYQADKITLSSYSSDKEAMRALGQRIAANIVLNYFDDKNISSHHVIRHEKPSRTAPQQPLQTDRPPKDELLGMKNRIKSIASLGGLPPEHVLSDARMAKVGSKEQRKSLQRVYSSNLEAVRPAEEEKEEKPKKSSMRKRQNKVAPFVGKDDGQ